ncbi:MAG TPA: sulfate ABC transporter substrate-binding protein [Candidatus Limnocylindrales bacterium]
MKAVKMTSRRSAALLVTAVLFVSACGGSGATASPTTPTSAPSAATSAAASPTSAAPSAQSTAAGSPAATATPFDATPGDVTLVAYSTPKAAYDAIIPLFQATPDGSGVNFEESFGASGDQSRAVAAGLPADYVAFSLSTDMDRLVKANMVAADWNSGSTKGMVTDSVVVLAVRPGNPKNIHTWDDLLQPGIGIITPNPFSSGGARWNIMAAYGAWIKAGLTQDQAVAKLTTFFHNILVQDTSARNATQTFLAGQGDVLISYENEAIAAKQGGQDLDYVVPDSTILIENPAAVTTVGDATDKAKAFLTFALSQPGQQTFANHGYRPVIDGINPPDGYTFPTPSGLFTIADLGGWPAVATKFFDPTNGIVTQIEAGVGVNP